MALCAISVDVMRLFVGNATSLVVAGVMLGINSALAMASVIERCCSRCRSETR
jgi:hypothetical protein